MMKRINSLEGLRGIATLMVLFSHLGVMFWPSFYWGGAEGVESHWPFAEYYLGQTPFGFALSGHSGVMIFFLLTGFGSFMVCNKGRESCVKYASLRFFKLAVLIGISTGMVWSLLKLNLTYYHNIVEYTHTIWIQGWGNTIDDNVLNLILGNWFTIGTTYNGALWTMPYIFYGSVACVMIYVLWGDLHKSFIVPFCAVVLLVIFDMPNYAACILGYLLAFYYTKNPDRQINVILGGILLLLGIGLCGFPMVVEPQYILYRLLPREYVVYYHLAGAILLVYVSLFWKPVKRIMESKVLLALGKYSMSFYIIHFVILMSVTSYLFMRIINYYSYNAAVLIVWVATIFVTYVAAIPLKWLIDRIYGVMNRLYDKVYGVMAGET